MLFATITAFPLYLLQTFNDVFNSRFNHGWVPLKRHDQWCNDARDLMCLETNKIEMNNCAMTTFTPRGTIMIQVGETWYLYRTIDDQNLLIELSGESTSCIIKWIISVRAPRCYLQPHHLHILNYLTPPVPVGTMVRSLADTWFVPPEIELFPTCHTFNIATNQARGYRAKG